MSDVFSFFSFVGYISYKLNLKNDEGPEYVFQAEFDTSERAKDDNEWEIIRIPFSKFVPKVRGEKSC